MLTMYTLPLGFGRVLITAVGEQSRWGKTKAKLSTEAADTPLQEKLDKLAQQIGHGGMSAAAATFLAMLALWFLHPEWRDPNLTLLEFVLKAFIMGVTIVVVAVPEGLPLAVTLSLAYSTQKMMLDNNLIRVLAACETMGNATNICSDKTGTLTQNKMTVVEGWIAGKHYESTPTPDGLHQSLIDYLADGIAVNTTAALLGDEVYGNKTEGALLIMLDKQFGQDYKVRRPEGFKAKRGDKLLTFSSARKRMTVIQNLKDVCRVYTKGAAEVMVGLCTKYSGADGKAKEFDNATRLSVLRRIESMGKNSLRAIVLAHRDMSKDMIDAPADLVESNLTLDALFGIKVMICYVDIVYKPEC